MNIYSFVTETSSTDPPKAQIHCFVNPMEADKFAMNNIKNIIASSCNDLWYLDRNLMVFWATNDGGFRFAFFASSVDDILHILDRSEHYDYNLTDVTNTEFEITTDTVVYVNIQSLISENLGS